VLKAARKRCRPGRGLYRDRDGLTLLFWAFSFLGIFAFLVIVVDSGLIFVQRRQLQNTADAARLGRRATALHRRRCGDRDGGRHRRQQYAGPGHECRHCRQRAGDRLREQELRQSPAGQWAQFRFAGDLRQRDRSARQVAAARPRRVLRRRRARRAHHRRSCPGRHRRFAGVMGRSRPVPHRLALRRWTVERRLHRHRWPGKREHARVPARRIAKPTAAGRPDADRRLGGTNCSGAAGPS